MVYLTISLLSCSPRYKKKKIPVQRKRIKKKQRTIAKQPETLLHLPVVERRLKNDKDNLTMTKYARGPCFFSPPFACLFLSFRG